MMKCEDCEVPLNTGEAHDCDGCGATLCDEARRNILLERPTVTVLERMGTNYETRK